MQKILLQMLIFIVWTTRDELNSNIGSVFSSLCIYSTVVDNKYDETI